jgi:carboxymethylenebutenolidase
MVSGETVRTGREIEVESAEGAFAAYLGVPATGAGPGVLVLQEWWGLVPNIRDVCDRLARAGFVALAPDLYRGESTSDPDEAGRLMMALEIEQAGRDVEVAVETLRRQPETSGSRVGCIGFCMGGQLALHAACLCEPIAAVVDCYGVHPNVSLDLERCGAKVLGIFAENDEFIPASAVRALEADLEAAGVEARLQTYVGVQHAFMNESRLEVYDAETAARAWRDVETFFEAELS